ncbi:MAG: hypothetical protein ACYTE8_00050 [Planctomycetota bacterium]|jgi:hypothetical protein
MGGLFLIIILLLIAVFIIFVIISLDIVFSSFVQELSMKQGRVQRVENNDPSEDAQAWAVSNGFEFVGNYRIQSIYFSGWEHTKRPTFFYEYKVQFKKFYALVTIFSNHIKLTTGNSKNDQLDPKQDRDYVQSFTKMSFEHRWEKHVESENYLIEKGGVKLPDILFSFEEYLGEMLDKELENHRRFRFYHFRVLWWYFFRRGRRHNKSIQKQHELGITRLPNEII